MFFRMLRCTLGLPRRRLLQALLPFSTALLFTLMPLGTRAAETIRSASELDYPPYAVVTRDGQADGFGVEMLREALREVPAPAEVAETAETPQDEADVEISGRLHRTEQASTESGEVIEGIDDSQDGFLV